MFFTFGGNPAWVLPKSKKEVAALQQGGSRLTLPSFPKTVKHSFPLGNLSSGSGAARRIWPFADRDARFRRETRLPWLPGSGKPQPVKGLP